MQLSEKERERKKPPTTDVNIEQLKSIDTPSLDEFDIKRIKNYRVFLN